MLQGEHSAIISTFIKLPYSIKTFVLSIFKWPLKTGFTVCTLYTFQVKTDLETELLINKIQLGWLDTAFLLPYALMQVFITRIPNKKKIQIRPNKKTSVFWVTGLKS